MPSNKNVRTTNTQNNISPPLYYRTKQLEKSDYEIMNLSVLTEDFGKRVEPWKYPQPHGSHSCLRLLCNTATAITAHASFSALARPRRREEEASFEAASTTTASASTRQLLSYLLATHVRAYETSIFASKLI